MSLSTPVAFRSPAARNLRAELNRASSMEVFKLTLPAASALGRSNDVEAFHDGDASDCKEYARAEIQYICA
jgi:hypothetical protein